MGLQPGDNKQKSPRAQNQHPAIWKRIKPVKIENQYDEDEWDPDWVVI